MTSQELTDLGFGSWLPITTSTASNKNLILSLPRKDGVYILKTSSALLRLKGKSDLIYIGHGKIQTRIQNLLIKYLPIQFKNYHSKHTAHKELERIMSETDLELAYWRRETRKMQRQLKAALSKDTAVTISSPHL